MSYCKKNKTIICIGLTLFLLVFQIHQVFIKKEVKLFVTTTGERLILMWYGQSLEKLNCIRPVPERCIFTEDRNLLHKASAVVFYSDFLTVHDLPNHRYPQQKWVFYHMEAPIRLSPKKYAYLTDDQWADLDAVEFNWTMSYERDSDVVTPYFDINCQRRQPGTVGNDSSRLSNRKKDALWIVSNCDAPSKRHKVVELLKDNGILVDVFGGCGHAMKEPTGARYRGGRELYSQYKYYLAFENSLCTDYVTEKFAKTLMNDVDIIPIVFNRADVLDFFTPQVPGYKYINAGRFDNVSSLATYLKHLNENATALDSFFTWKNNWNCTVSNEVFGDQMCRICEKLHSPSFAEISNTHSMKEREYSGRCVSKPSKYFQ